MMYVYTIIFTFYIIKNEISIFFSPFIFLYHPAYFPEETSDFLNLGHK